MNKYYLSFCMTACINLEDQDEVDGLAGEK